MVPPKADRLRNALRGSMGRMLLDRSCRASDRYEAAMSLARDLQRRKKDLDVCARLARSARIDVSLPAATRLAQCKDQRGREVLQRFMTADDSALGEVAALILSFEYADKAAADRLAATAAGQDVRFQLSAGYALKLMRDPRADRYAFSKLPGCTMGRIDEGMIKSFPTVEGYEVANVWSQPMVRPAQYGAGYSVYYVQWVHTHPRWRRRGLARAGMDDNLNCHWDRECAMTSLHTGVRNVAHALYRDYRLIDYYRGLRFEKQLRSEAPPKPPEGVRIRRATERDHDQAMALFRAQQEKLPVELGGDGRFDPERHAFVALKKREIIGYAEAVTQSDTARLDRFATAALKDRKGEPDPAAREQVGIALLSNLHARLLASKAKKIECYHWNPSADPHRCWVLRRAGYGSALLGGVELFRLNSLQQYLSETRISIERRLKDSPAWARWCGTIMLSSSGAEPSQQAVLQVDAGKVTITDKLSAGQSASVLIRGDLVALQRLVSGITSGFDEYYQIHIDTAPLMNESTLELLETLFPKLVVD